ncbi:MAG: tRNA (adenosine(37)-N6)-dimethylallyltransferase MiaA [Myxococcales bacterium]|jgi:tRNA dimethylallyltransferase|nr:tRNA (adenosine(37)-N6)-dimethylallyltransferase MiaA [Myxococcales bacterium]
MSRLFPSRPLFSDAEHALSALDFVAIVGPTASGKSALALALAESIGAEIVSCDSQHVYRRLDIGTAKPTLDDRVRVPHHLIDVCSPTEQLSAGDFVRMADAALADIRHRGKRAVVVGGTGLWLRALVFGMIEVPESSPEVRERLERALEAEGKAALFERLRAIDPIAAERIDAHNSVRVVRALELFELTGERPSALWERHAFRTPRHHARTFGLSPPRERLYARIDARTRQMFDTGLLDEARALLDEGLGNAAALQRAIGYPQALAHLAGELSLEAAIETTARATRRYAKRQWTWFKAERQVEWLDAHELAPALDELVQRLATPTRRA